MQKKQAGFHFLIRVTTIFLLVSGLFITLNINTDLQTKDIALHNLDQITIHKPAITAKEFCQSTLKENFGTIHCGTNDPRYLDGWDENTHQIALEELQTSLNTYTELLEKIHSVKEINSSLVEIESATQRKIFQIDRLIGISKTKLKSDQYKDIFNALLIAQGISYNPYTNRFKSSPQNLAQYALNQSSVKQQLERLSFFSKNLQYFFLLFCAIAYLLIRNQIDITGQMFSAFYFLLMACGLSIIRDASLHYGGESSLFDLNPFRQILERQLSITLLAIGLFFICLLGTRYIQSLVNATVENLSPITSSLLLTIFTLLSYFVFGSAIGSETFKLSTCLISAAILFKYGRPIELAREKFGLQKMLWRSLNNLTSKAVYKREGQELVSLKIYFSNYMSKKILFQLILVATLMAVVAVIFSDLGGALISACIFTFMLFILLGRKFALTLLAVFSCVSVFIFTLSEKIQSRVQLMAEPMRANISDFARLIQFEQAAQPWGYRFGYIQWCSPDGNCVPLQSLSDYMPTLLSGWIGRIPSLIILCAFTIALLWLAYQCFISAWQVNDSYRYLKIFSALLCLASLFQLLVTLMGNLRVIPLTGLGTPLISIGISSLITTSIGLGLAISLCYKNK